MASGPPIYRFSSLMAKLYDFDMFTLIPNSLSTILTPAFEVLNLITAKNCL